MPHKKTSPKTGEICDLSFLNSESVKADKAISEEESL